MNSISFLYKIRLFAIIGLIAACKNTNKEYYTSEDFKYVKKIDVHFHYLTSDVQFINFAASQNFKLLSPNTDMGVSIYLQWDVAKELLRTNSSEIGFLSSFSLEKFGKADFTSSVITYISQCRREGSSGIKIWKNIGMEFRDAEGLIVMADDPEFAPIFQYLEKNEIPLMAHLGEPLNCWLPIDEMTVHGDKVYYKNNPKYHMFLHPEMPTYEDQIEARDNLLEKFPDLIFVGAHLGSMEWNLDSLSEYFDKFPNFYVDISARIAHIKNQSSKDRNHIRQFFVKYQDRLLYGTDDAVYDAKLKNYVQVTENILKTWKSDWIYFATDSTTNNAEGLKLPAQVIDKFYYKNAKRIYKLNNF